LEIDREEVLACFPQADAEISPELMELQLATALSLLHSGTAHDVIFLGSPIVDMPIKMVERTREWVQQHKDEALSEIIFR
jgi:hypothetical protein